MTHIPQSLHQAFPAQADLLRRLKTEDRHFQRLASRYEDIDQQIAQMVAGEDPASDERLEDARKQRLALLDEIASMIADQTAKQEG